MTQKKQEMDIYEVKRGIDKEISTRRSYRLDIKVGGGIYRLLANSAKINWQSFLLLEHAHP